MDNNLIKILENVDPSALDYQEWCNVGMALKHEGYTVDDWERWSMSDIKRYHRGECAKKWETFNGSASPVTAGTIVQYAKNQGWKPQSKIRELDWNDEISIEVENIVNSNEGVKIYEPKAWDPVKEIVTYLETLFEASENVGYVTETWESKDDGKIKYLPTKGSCSRTAGELIEQLNKCDGDIGAVLGDFNPKAGAWIRFNPLDGKGVKNENVTDYRYALVESDNMPIEIQNAVIRELELPVAVLVYSGGKSIHAIVKIDAADYGEYKKRVDYLYSVCEKSGFEIDKQNRNPSRLSRMPGVERNGQKQYIVDTNIGKSSWNDWKEYIESINDDLPDIKSLADVWDDMPELADSLIDGVLRKGHKMLIAGPSKAGKSFALIELSIAIAEGQKWMGFNCAQGEVLYVNLELDEASCWHRLKDVYTALKIPPKNLKNIDVWNLRGKSCPMDKLVPKLIRRASKKNYLAIIIDPIYKVITGDENSADQMAYFCNQFDKICSDLKCAVIYCHHHSKGFQGGKRSVDRASGSGVFARDPDAFVDLTELDLTDEIISQLESKAACSVCAEWLNRFGKSEEASQDDLCSEKAMLEICHKSLEPKSYMLMMNDIKSAKEKAAQKTAWRIEGTLREFKTIKPVNCWFDYPIHKNDDSGILADIELDSGYNSKHSPYGKNFSKKKTSEERKEERKESIETAFEACNVDGKVTVTDLAEYCGISEKTVRRRIKEHGGFWVDENEIGLK